MPRNASIRRRFSRYRGPPYQREHAPLFEHKRLEKRRLLKGRTLLDKGCAAKIPGPRCPLTTQIIMTSWFQTRLYRAKLVSNMIKCAPCPCHKTPTIFKNKCVLLEFCRTLITNHYVKVWLARVFPDTNH